MRLTQTIGTFSHNEAEYEIRAVKDSTTRSTKTKIYASSVMDSRSAGDEFSELAEKLGANTVYTQKGDFPELDKAFSKMNREIVACKKEVLEAAKNAGLLEYEKVAFSRNGGCFCGCSPCFLAEVCRVDGVRFTDVWIDRK